MKKLIFFFVFLTIVFVTKAQTVKYDTCSNLHQYEGEWRYVNGQDTIRFYLRAHRTIDPDFISDALWGWLEYKKGNTIIESDYQHRFMNLLTTFFHPFLHALGRFLCFVILLNVN